MAMTMVMVVVMFLFIKEPRKKGQRKSVLEVPFFFPLHISKINKSKLFLSAHKENMIYVDVKMRKGCKKKYIYIYT